MKIKEIVDALERFAPLPLQDDFDNAGLQVGLTEVEATGALLCLDITEAVVDEAIALGFNLVISHHPLIFKPLKSITGKTYQERCIIKALSYGVTIYSAHTNLDNANKGVSFKMAEKLGLRNVRVLDPQENSLIKLVTYVPLGYEKTVQTALFDAGCGCIGHYDECCNRIIGEGTFRPLPGSSPFCGTIGQHHVQPEIRIETALPAYLKHAALDALIHAHPYEEPVYDFYTLRNAWQQVGAGVIGELKNPEAEQDFLRHVKKTFKLECLRHNNLKEKDIRTVALCGGAGAFLIPQALSKHADAFLTGEIKYHDYFGHKDDILLIEIGHYESEQYTGEILEEILRSTCPHLDIRHTKLNTNPITYT